METVRNKPANIYELFRLALSAQVDLGGDEVVLRRKHPVIDIPSRLKTGVTREEIPVARAIADAGEQSMLAEYQSVPATVTTARTVMDENLFDDHFDSLDSHLQAICDCQKCPLGKTRTRFVYGVGNPDADIMFIGEAPGADEDRLGEPFVGRAGKLLDKILAAMKLSRNEVYIANILKCRPPSNRDPLPDEMAKCRPYLREQVRLIDPKIICLLGRVAAQALLETSTPLGKLRKRWHRVYGVSAIVTYHPAALLRFQAYKKETWADMQELMRHYSDMQ